MLSDVGNSIAVDIYTSRLSETLGVDKQAITARMEAIRRRKRAKNKNSEFRKVQQSFSAGAGRAAAAGGSLRSQKAQKRVLTLLYSNPDFLPELQKTPPEDLFGDPLCRRVHEALAKRIETGGSLDFTALAGELSPEEMDLLVGACKKDEGLPGSKEELLDCVATLHSERKKQLSRSTQAAALDDDAFRALFRPTDKT